jgi:hypothetical protein
MGLSFIVHFDGPGQPMHDWKLQRVGLMNSASQRVDDGSLDDPLLFCPRTNEHCFAPRRHTETKTT